MVAQTVGAEMLPITLPRLPGPTLWPPGCEMKRGAGQHGEGHGGAQEEEAEAAATYPLPRGQRDQELCPSDGQARLLPALRAWGATPPSRALVSARPSQPQALTAFRTALPSAQ